MSKVAVTIEYAGMQLQIIKNAAGEEVTPLKPISDLFGLRWEGQRRKVTESEFYREYLGICTPARWGADGQSTPLMGGANGQNHILLSRVAAYMMTISPEVVSAQGNVTGAKFLEAKLNEWADALHDYEVLGVAINKNQLGAAKLELARINALVRLQAVKNRTDSKNDRKALTDAQRVITRELGLPIQTDLVDGQ
ncbi:MAG TPA: hypothetical protein VIO56_03065 [Methylotenera sp.]